MEHGSSGSIGDDCRFVAVEMPVLFQEPRTAIALLGGAHAARQVATGRSSHVDVRLRPHDPFCHTARIQSSDQNGTEMVLRVRHGESRPEILGVVERAYRRPLVSDFQYLPSYREEWNISSRDVRNVIAGTARSGRTVVPLQIARALQASARSGSTDKHLVARLLRDFVPREGMEDRLRCPLLPALLIPPSHFTQDYELRPFDFSGLRTTAATSEESRRESAALTRAVFVPKLGVPVPSRPLAVPSMQHFPGKDRESLLHHLFRLFELRPVWNRRSLASLLQEKEGFQGWWKLLLPAVAYFVQQGPFRYSWIRLGYDTSAEPTSRVYQTLDARLTQQRLSAVGMRSASAAAARGQRSSSSGKPNAASASPNASPTKGGERGVDVPDNDSDEGDEDEEADAGSSALRPPSIAGLPASRQLCYPIIDLHAEPLTRLPPVSSVAAPPLPPPSHAHALPHEVPTIAEEFPAPRVRRRRRRRRGASAPSVAGDEDAGVGADGEQLAAGAMEPDGAEVSAALGWKSRLQEMQLDPDLVSSTRAVREVLLPTLEPATVAQWEAALPQAASFDFADGWLPPGWLPAARARLITIALRRWSDEPDPEAEELKWEETPPPAKGTATAAASKRPRAGTTAKRGAVRGKRGAARGAARGKRGHSASPPAKRARKK